MAVNSGNDPSEGPGGTQNTGGKGNKPGSGTLTEAQRKRKQECQRNAYARNKQKKKSTAAEVETLKETCAHTKGQLHQVEKNLKEARDQTSLKQEHLLETIQQAVTEVGKKVEKDSALLLKLWNLIERKDSAGTRDRSSTFASSKVLEVFPHPMAISAMRLKGLGMTGPFIPCQSVHPAFNKLEEQNTASEALLMQEMATTEARHAEEIAAIVARHAQEMDATKERHAQEMATIRAGYGGESENNGQELAGPSHNFDADDFFTAAVRAGYGGESENNEQELAGPSRKFDADDGDTGAY